MSPPPSPSPSPPPPPPPPQLSESGLLGSVELTLGSAIACFLAWEGADISYANHKGKSPLDLVTDPAMVQVIKGFAEKHRYGPDRRVVTGLCVSVCLLGRGDHNEQYHNTIIR